jgi:hypothetical protein
MQVGMAGDGGTGVPAYGAGRGLKSAIGAATGVAKGMWRAIGWLQRWVWVGRKLCMARGRNGREVTA